MSIIKDKLEKMTEAESKLYKAGYIHKKNNNYSDLGSGNAVCSGINFNNDQKTYMVHQDWGTKEVTVDEHLAIHERMQELCWIVDTSRIIEKYRKLIDIYIEKGAKLMEENVRLEKEIKELKEQR